MTEDSARIEERRRQILDAAARVFARRGYQGARTREIAAEAGVAEGTIYNYFHNKRDLLLAFIQHIATDSLPATLAQMEAKDLHSWLTAFLHDRLALLDRNRSFILAVAPEIFTDVELREEYLRRVVYPMVLRFLPALQRAMQDGNARPFKPRVVFPALVFGAAAAFAANEYTALQAVGSPSSREELVEELVQLYLYGLQRPAERLQPPTDADDTPADWRSPAPDEQS